MNDPLHDIKHYSPTMTISQVLKFCEKKEMQITRGMIQNYIRAGVLPAPVQKRFYTHKHLAVLAVIDRLKTVFDMPKILKELSPFMDDEGLPLDVYFEIISETKKFFSDKKPAGTLVKMSCAAEMKGQCFI